jgi:dTDP-4-amino-4,6-dideoxygalactose transaminase
MSVSAAERHRSVLPPAEQYGEVGYNFRMTDLQAAVGLVQLGRLDAVVARRRNLATRYRERLAGLPGLRCVEDPLHGKSNFQSFWVEVGRECPVTRDQLLERLALADISARRGIMAAHRQPAYREAEHQPLPVTDRLTDRTLILPLFHGMTDEQLARVISVLTAGAGGIP